MNDLSTYNGSFVASASFTDTAGDVDFNGDGIADILWQDSASGVVAIWEMGGGSVTGSAIIAAVSSSWNIVRNPGLAV